MSKLLPNPLARLLSAALLVFSAAFLGLHFVHLAADFPNNSPWMDWSKYTDEGWYGDAAIRHFQLGHWYLAGDFNPAAALPVWPFLEGILFHFTGVSLLAARAATVCVFAAILLTSWLLLQRWRPSVDADLPSHANSRRPLSLAPYVAVFLLAVSPFCFVFTRMAILEPFLILLMLLSLLAASTAKPAAAIVRANLLPILALGGLLPAMILTKTTALFLMPALFWLLFAALDYQFRPFLRVAIPAAGLALLLWLGWFGYILAHHYLLDYRYLFSANGYTGITLANASTVLSDTVTDGMWMGSVLFPASMLALLLALVSWVVSWRRVRSLPLAVSLMLWAGGYVFFLAYHDNLQPRYYLVVAVPLTLLLSVVFELFLLGNGLILGPRGLLARRLALVAVAAVVGIIGFQSARQTLHFVRHPDYTLLGAARELEQYITEDHKRDPAHSPLLLSISGSDISLMTGLHSINDDFGTLELVNRVALYKPGWYAAWNDLEDDKMEALAPYYHVERVAEFPSMDDPDRNLLILYRLDDGSEPQPARHPGKPVPRRMRTRLGQQPSTSQLEH